uniref:Tropomyosin n=1 Tax=Ciona savignyi TaxID=51511 RepID=H2ZGY7_CIOSA
MEQIKKKVAALRTDNEEKEIRIDELEKKLRNQDEKYAELEQTLMQSERRLNLITNENETLENLARENELKFREAEKGRDAAEHELCTLKNVVSQLEDDLEKAEEIAEKAKSELENTLAELGDI